MWCPGIKAVAWGQRWYIIKGKHKVGKGASKTFQHPRHSRRLRARASLTLLMKSPTLRLCFWSLLWCVDAPLPKKSSAPHLWNTYIPHVTHPEGSIIPRLVSVASTLLSVSVFWLQGLSIYSFKSSGHLLDLWWWSLWPWDAWAVPIEIPFPVGKEGRKKSPFSLRFWAMHRHAEPSTAMFYTIF